jgi:UDP-glucose 4-epimerase
VNEARPPPVVVVSGGAGFIGSHVVDELRRAGRGVIVLEALRRGGANLAHRRTDAGLAVVQGDAAEPWGAALAAARRGALAGPVAAVIHLAAQIDVQRSLADPALDARENLIATLQAIDFAAAEGARLVFASSAAVYGATDAAPTREESAQWPRSPYGIHKLAAEMHVRVAAQLRGLSAICLRFFNVYGPRQDPQSPYAGVIARFLRRALAGEALEIYGDGEQTRDFVYIDDVVSGVVAACERGPRDGSALNLGSGREHSVRELAERVLLATRSEVAVRRLPERRGELRRSRAEIQRAWEALSYAPRVGLDAGLARTVGWMSGAARTEGEGAR